jgi:peptidoglycan/xylan/chitin deacetylase (PgdA/CDA1 family)
MSAVAPTVALTFDDGPDPAWTPIILHELRRLEAGATFFLIAPCAVANPHVVEAMVEAGHGVGLHCWDHVRHSARTRAEVERDTDRALAALAVLGAAPVLWRTPWGDTAPWTEEVARERGLELAGWTADSHDWRGDTAAEMLSGIEGDLAPGGIVLMHDGLGPGARRRDCLQTLRLLGPLCARIGAMGCIPAPLASARAAR